jgi:L-serine dehydratase
LCIGGKFTEGLIGVFITKKHHFCVAETGSAGGMAIAALALQNSLGLICDPKDKRVEATCLGRNVKVASNAVSSANMAFSNYAHLIPIEEVIP